MLNPDDLVAAWVDRLKTVDALVAALGGTEVYQIVGYKDQFPSANNLRRAVMDAAPGTMLVGWKGTGKRRVGTAEQFSHGFFFVVRAPKEGAYGTIFNAFVNGLLREEIDSGCYPMDLDFPTAQRVTLLVSQDGTTLDYFEFGASLVERGAF